MTKVKSRLQLSATFILTCSGVLAADLTVTADFEGASVRVVKIDPATQTVSFTPGGDARRGWPCWWYFRVDELSQNKPLTLRLHAPDAAVGKSKPLSSVWAMPARATWSTDGEVWRHTERGTKDGDWMVYSIQPEAESVFVAWGPPYTPARAEEFIQKTARTHTFATARELCRSREDRSVPMLYVAEGERSPSERFGVWVQARQHAWECGSSWVAQGFAEWLVSNDVNAAWLRKHAEVYIVPVMDVDNTATGNGGKNTIPHDHNRDWSEQPHWNEVAAAKRTVQKLINDGRMHVFLDLHNPAPGDPSFFYILPADLLDPQTVRLRNQFIDLAYKKISQIKPMIPMSINPKVTGPKYHPLWKHISSNWVAMNGNRHTVSLCLETIWNAKNSTATGYRDVGASLAASVQDFLKATAK